MSRMRRRIYAVSLMSFCMMYGYVTNLYPLTKVECQFVLIYTESDTSSPQVYDDTSATVSHAVPLKRGTLAKWSGRHTNSMYSNHTRPG